MLMPPSVREWLPEGHLAFFVLDTVAELDLAAFFAAYRADGRGGRPGGCGQVGWGWGGWWSVPDPGGRIRIGPGRAFDVDDAVGDGDGPAAGVQRDVVALA